MLYLGQSPNKKERAYIQRTINPRNNTAVKDDNMKDFLQEIGINITLSIAGLFGSLLMVGKQAIDNIRQTGIALITGVASANYMTPVVCDFVRINEQQYQNGIAFILGFLGLKGVEVFTKKFIKNHGNDVDGK
jgi:hypothetical protein